MTMNVFDVEVKEQYVIRNFKDPKGRLFEAFINTQYHPSQALLVAFLTLVFSPPKPYPDSLKTPGLIRICLNHNNFN
jgi:hypothetical protein